MKDCSAMDPRIWSKLPPDVMEHILLLLPLKTLLNLRPTCKAFTSLLFSPSFISKHSSSSPFSSFLLLSHPQYPHHFPLYDSQLCSWRNFSPSLHCSSSSTLLSSSGGLFCLSDPSSSSFLVCNLFVKSSRKIEYPIPSLHLGHLTLVTTPVGYNIVLLCSESASNSAFVYDSKVLSWRRFEGFSAVLSDNYHQRGTFFDGGLYFTTPEPFSVVRFDLESGKWERLVGELPNELTFVRLTSDGEGKLYLLGGVGDNGISRSIKLWEMGGEGDWVEMQRLPEMMCRKFVSVCYHNYEHVYCFWHDGMVCVCCYTWPEMLYYSVLRRTWRWLPKCPYLPLKCSCGFKWFSFVPKLYASV
ncbi:F-box/kelch-repeat protein At5g43190-like [Abrus precatorius]|uniref:F-box/kelch-repeat protein At5g43190-like n=1 Tax=Abrus precatorius TaxID=3816 RepID=A0A8B8LL72_ABRPR|nr:F-box/kelch-repeat protein At5g43190-like [Abrus precatorius]